MWPWWPFNSTGIKTSLLTFLCDSIFGLPDPQLIQQSVMLQYFFMSPCECVKSVQACLCWALSQGVLVLISTCVKICPDSLPSPPAETLQVSRRRMGPSRKSNSHISSFDLFIWLAAFWSGRHGRARYFSRDCLLQQAWHGQEIGVLPSQYSVGASTGGRAFTLPLLNRERSFYPAVLLSLFPNAAQLACRAAIAYVTCHFQMTWYI